MRIPEGDEYYYPDYVETTAPASLAAIQKCRDCGKSITLKQKHLVCLHCDAHFHGACQEQSPACLGCQLPTLRVSVDDDRSHWPCWICETNFTLVSGFCFCASCGATFHEDCRGFSGACPNCQERAPVFVNGEKEVNLHWITRLLRGRETLNDCFIAWCWTSSIALMLYAFLGSLGFEIGARVLAIWGLNTLWWIYCGILSTQRPWASQ